MKNPYEKYRDQSITTLTQGEMVVKLYEEIINQLNKAKIAISQKDYNTSNNSLKKAQDILNHLDSTLNFKYEISNNLSSLYLFFIQELISANIKKDVTIIDSIIPLIVELKDVFAQGEKNNRIQNNKN